MSESSRDLNRQPKRRSRVQKRKQRLIRRIFLFVLVLTVALAAMLLVWKTAAPPKKLTDSISIPGFECIYLEADVAVQQLSVPNPPENSCQFRISLLMPDGAVLWTSELILPGEQNKSPIMLNMPLAAGEYPNATLKYECFTLEQYPAPLNGTTIQLPLIVIQTNRNEELV